MRRPRALLFKPDYLWDFKSYYYAVTAFNQGYNPYNTPALISHYGFYLYPLVYLPPALLVFEPFSWFDFQQAAGLFILIKLGMLVSLVYLWLKYFLEKQPGIWFFLFCLLAFNSSLYVDFTTGNIGIIEQFFLWWGFYYWRRHNLKIFCACILMAGFFKLLPLLFLTLLLFSPVRSRWFYLAVSMLAGGGLIAGSWLTNPPLFTGFLQNAVHMDERGVINPSTLSLLSTPVLCF